MTYAEPAMVAAVLRLSKWFAGGMWVGLAAGWLQRMNESEMLERDGHDR